MYPQIPILKDISHPAKNKPSYKRGKKCNDIKTIFSHMICYHWAKSSETKKQQKDTYLVST